MYFVFSLKNAILIIVSNITISEGQKGREKGCKYQNYEIIFYDFLIIIALIETLIGLN